MIYSFCVNLNRFQWWWIWIFFHITQHPKLFHYTSIIGCKIVPLSTRFSDVFDKVFVASLVLKSTLHFWGSQSYCRPSLSESVGIRNTVCGFTDIISMSSIHNISSDEVWTLYTPLLFIKWNLPAVKETYGCRREAGLLPWKCEHVGLKAQRASFSYFK